MRKLTAIFKKCSFGGGERPVRSRALRRHKRTLVHPNSRDSYGPQYRSSAVKLITPRPDARDAANAVEQQPVLVRHAAQIVLAAFRAGCATLRKHVGRFSTLPSTESRTACGIRPAFRQGWKGEGKPMSMPWRGPAGAQQPPHGGVYFGLGNERAKPLAFLPIKEMEATASLRRAVARRRCSRTARRRWAAWRRAERRTRASRHRRNPAGGSERETAARSAKREARASADQHENTKPLRAHSAG